ncbi:MAG: aminotransferase class I/II-fold pyridoxal phosphate-dependent enzyme [Planctomycetota bacterium]
MTDLAAPPRTGPVPRAGLPSAYSAASALPPIDLWLAGNEGRPAAALVAPAETPSTAPERYPDAGELEARLAERFDLGPDQVIVTAGADDALLRIALAYLGPDRTALLPEPTFGMIERYVRIAGAAPRRVTWEPGVPFPTDAFLEENRPDVVYVVSPNNPTGAVASADDVRRLSAAFPNALIVVDAAYAEFTDDDLTRTSLELPNAIVLRTFSKAFGAASLRVGYALGRASVVAPLRAAGNPYPCASASLARAAELLDVDVSAFVDRVRRERSALAGLLGELGLDASAGQGNFVYARTDRAPEIAALLAGLGIAVRAFDDPWPALRITCPGEPERFERLERALRAVCAPEALLFDMDGVLADVSRSYRGAILRTARSFGVRLSAGDIDRAKANGDANDDWSLTQRMLAERGVDAELAEVTRRFERFYQGKSPRPGLKSRERLLVPKDQLARLRGRARLGIVTGRPRSDAAEFLERFGLTELFDSVVCREDAELKPDPAPTRLALEQLGATSAWLVGDTPDDVRSARSAGVVPIGVDAGVGADALRASGAGVVVASATALEELLP